FRSTRCWRRERRHYREFGFRRYLTDDVLHPTMAAAENLVECGTGIGRQVETIGDLDRIGCALLSTLSICAGTIANDDLHTKMLAEPIGEHFCGPFVQQVDRSMCFEVDQECAVSGNTAASAQRYVIDTQHARRSDRRVDHRVQQPQQRIGADRHAGLTRQTSSAFAACLQRECHQQLSCAVGAPGIAGQYTIEALGEDFAWTIWHIAEPPSGVDSQTYGVAAPGQVEWASKITAVLA